MKVFLVLAILLSASISVCAHFMKRSTCETCATDEACNTTTSHCDCNLSLYTNTGDYPSPTITCDGGKMNVFVSKCWLEKNLYETSTITLKDSSCVALREIVNDTAHMTFHNALTNNGCGNTVNITATDVTYYNALYIFAAKTEIEIKSDVIMNFSCSYPLNIKVQFNITIHPVIGTVVIPVPGTNFTTSVNMIAYIDSSFTTPLTADDILYVEDTIYISVIIPELNVDTFSLQVIDIKASDGQSGPSYSLLDNGCPSTGITADLMSVLYNGNGSESRFAMKVFQISGSSAVQLSADVKVCVKNCVINCSKKSAVKASREDTATVSISLTADERFTYDSANCVSMSWIMSAILSSLLLVRLM